MDLNKILNGYRLLIVDDEEDLLETIFENLTLFGASVFKASSCDAALALVTKESTFDFILSDVRMPGSDGLYFLRRVRELSPETPPFFFLTGFASNYSLDDLLSRGANGVLEKPYKMDQLIQLIQKSVKRP